MILQIFLTRLRAAVCGIRTFNTLLILARRFHPVEGCSRLVATALISWTFASEVRANEIPLGGRYDDVAERFNRVAGKMKLDVRLDRRECKAEVLCRYAFNASLLGHGSAIDIGQPTLETMLFTHDCSAADAIVLRKAAAVFVKMFGAGAASPADLDRLASRVAGDAGGQATVVIGGVEFTNSATSCTLLIARPLREPLR